MQILQYLNIILYVEYMSYFYLEGIESWPTCFAVLNATLTTL